LHQTVVFTNSRIIFKLTRCNKYFHIDCLSTNERCVC
jgi:hypothetical protein